ncbi:MAG: endolytic transglycosylase MltG [Alphaproteobacteria bacterium]
MAFAVSALVVAGGLFAFYGLDRFERPGPLAADTVIYIPQGAGVEAIARQLHEAGAIEDPLMFRLGVRLLRAGHELRAGEYLFAAALSTRDTIDLLRRGETVVRRLTLAEGLTSHEIVALVEQAEALEGRVDIAPPEGSLLPETYHYARGDRRAEVIARMGRARDRLLSELWLARAPNLPVATPEQAVVLASIIEKETGVAAERARVASVFVNRLRKGMRLQSDPTVVYGLTGGKGPLGRALTRKDLQAPSPYNTYLNPGLPPGPIANPGRASLEAVLDPAKTAFLYFVADGSGGHAFAKTLAEHNRNVAKWRKFKKQNSN